MALHKLVFDTTDAASIAASANVGAYLRSSDGTLLTHTDVGGKKALDVRIAEGINVEVDLDAGDDSVAAWLSDGAGNAVGSTGGAIHISDAGGSITVDATDLDIRNLSAAQDNVAISDGTDTLGVNADGSINITDNGGSLTVDASQLDIDDLNATDDAVQAWTFDGTGNAIGSTAGALNAYITGSGPLTINDAALANTAIQADDEDVTTTSAALLTTNLSNRKYIYLYNNGNKTVYIGGSGVATTDGFPVFPGSMLEMRAGAAVSIHAVSEAGTQDIRALQIS